MKSFAPLVLALATLALAQRPGANSMPQNGPPGAPANVGAQNPGGNPGSNSGNPIGNFGGNLGANMGGDPAGKPSGQNGPPSMHHDKREAAPGDWDDAWGVLSNPNLSKLPYVRGPNGKRDVDAEAVEAGIPEDSEGDAIEEIEKRGTKITKAPKPSKTSFVLHDDYTIVDHGNVDQYRGAPVVSGGHKKRDPLGAAFFAEVSALEASASKAATTHRHTSSAHH